MHGPGGGRGKWSHPGVPHKGWSCVAIHDLESDREICEMCEAQEIRFVHTMTHPDYPGALDCGCDCAGHMEGDLEGAKDRDRAMKNAAGRRRRWPVLTGWHLSTKGNPCIRHDGYLVTVFPKNGQWSASIALGRDKPIFARKLFPTKLAAQLASFDALVFIQAREARARQSHRT